MSASTVLLTAMPSYIGGDVERLDIDQRHDPGSIEPGKEIRDSPVIGHPGVLVADSGGEAGGRNWHPYIHVPSRRRV
jgi:hypothetical protein